MNELDTETEVDNLVQDFIHDFQHGYDTAKSLGQNVEYHTFDTITGFEDAITALLKVEVAKAKIEVLGKLKTYSRHPDRTVGDMTRTIDNFQDIERATLTAEVESNGGAEYDTSPSKTLKELDEL